MKVLVIRFSSIGDIVMTTPVIRCLHLQTGAEVQVVTKHSFAMIYQDNPYISKVHTLGEENWNELVAQLKDEKFDQIIDLHNSLRSIKLTIELKRPTRRVRKLSLRKALLIHTSINTLPSTHVSERGMDTVKQWGVKNDGLGMDYFVSKKAQDTIKQPPGTYATIALGTTHFTKNMPEALLTEVIDSCPLPLVMLGGPAEQKLGEQLASLFPDKATNLAGIISLDESAAYVEKSRFLIAGDTGLLHMAAALKKPTISLWGATIPEYGVFPYYGERSVPHYIHEVKLPCRPCSKHGSASCPKKHFNCMNLQDSQLIAQHMQDLFDIPFHTYS